MNLESLIVGAFTVAVQSGTNPTSPAFKKLAAKVLDDMIEVYWEKRKSAEDDADKPGYCLESTDRA